MKRFMLMGLIIVVAALIWVGCSKDNDDQEANVTDQQALTDMMTNDQDIEGLDTWAGDDGGSGAGAFDDVITPLRWHRHAVRHLVSVHVEIQGDTLATVTRTHSFDGFLRVVTDTSDTGFSYVDKPMYNTLVRKAHAVRVGRTRYPRRNWRISEITPEVLASNTPNPHTIWPTEVRIYVETLFEPILMTQITDPLHAYFSRDSLPAFATQAQIIVRVTANRDSSALAFLHPRVYQRVAHPRFEMRDDGIYPDEIAGDGIFAASFNAGDRIAIHGVGLDLLDRGTLYDSMLPYDAGGWAIPYRVIPPVQ